MIICILVNTSIIYTDFLNHHELARFIRKYNDDCAIYRYVRINVAK